MTSARYEPRSYAVEPDGFGKVSVIEWVPDPTDPQERINREAAILQHQWALRINIQIDRAAMTTAVYAKRTGQGPHRLGQVLRGAVVMRLTDIAAAQIVFGLSGWKPVLKSAENRPDYTSDRGGR